MIQLLVNKYQLLAIHKYNLIKTIVYISYSL